MNQPPKDIDGARVVCFTEVGADVKPTAVTTHKRDGRVLGPAHCLAICRYHGESSCCLFYCNEDWTVRTDTFHLSVEDAKHQAELEYEGISRYWKDAA
jgi:hypothetical protein